MKCLLYRTPDKKAEPRVDWVSSSSAYKKEEIDQPGAPRAKKITKVNMALISEHSGCKDNDYFSSFLSEISIYFVLFRLDLL